MNKLLCGSSIHYTMKKDYGNIRNSNTIAVNLNFYSNIYYTPPYDQIEISLKK